MPELPEVETVRRGLAPIMEGAVFAKVHLSRPDLRFPFAPDFIDRVQDQRLITLTRRAKFLQATLGSGDRLFMHLGMSGRFIIEDTKPQTQPQHPSNPKHHHVIFTMDNGARIIYNDPRRFGFMELVAENAPYRLDKIGPEPLSNNFNGPVLHAALQGKKTSIKQALLNQHIVAGLGNIYVCEALFRARIAPQRKAGSLHRDEAQSLVIHIKEVLTSAIAAGGSSLRDFSNTNGKLGYFQHSFDVYGKEAEPCPHCNAKIVRIAQSGRSTFFCPNCQT